MVLPRQLITVIPDQGTLPPSDQEIEKMIYALLNVEPINRTKRREIWRSAVGVIFSGFNKERLAKHQTQIAPIDSFVELNIETSLPALKKLMKQFYINSPNVVSQNIYIIKSSDIPSQISSVDGRFFHNIVYVAHPAEPDFYIRFADFHDYLVHEKRGEFIELTSALGAKSVRLSESEVNKKMTIIEGGVSGVPGLQIAASVKGGNSVDNNFTIFLEGTATPNPQQRPKVPEKTRWLKLEPLWKSMIAARLQNSITKMTVDFSYDSDFGVTANLSAEIENLGLQCGGSFKECRKFRQTYEVVFYPMEAYDQCS